MTEHSADWHLEEAERLLKRAAMADEKTIDDLREKGHSPDATRRWSFIERARVHVALANAMDIREKL